MIRITNTISRFKIIAILFTLAMMVTLWAGIVSAETLESDFTYTVVNGEAHITRYTGAELNVVVPSTLGGYPVTYIGNYVWVNPEINSITIPETVTGLGDESFSGRPLTAIIVADGNINYQSVDGVLYNKAGTVLISCPSGLTSLVVPQGVTSIGNNAFSGCQSLTSVTLPDGITSIGDSAFYCNYALSSINLPDSLTSIGEAAFYSCALTNVLVPPGVTTINRTTFSGCSKLTSITLHNGITDIGPWAFSSCTSLTSISIPEGITSINDGVFESCTGLTDIRLPDGITRIGFDAFRDCTGLTNIVLPETLTTIGNRSFGYCTGLTGVIIPASVTFVEDNAFWCCSNLLSVQFNSATTTIADSMSTINQSTHILGYDPSTAKDYAAKWSHTFRLIGTEASLYGMSVTKLPTKLNYLIGEELDITGIEVTGYRTDGTTVLLPVSVENITGFDSRKAMQIQTLTITLEGFQTSYDIRITSDLSGVDFTYEVVDGEAKIIGYMGTGGDITIPSSLDGYPVTSIAGSAFQSNRDITSISIPEGLRTIDYGAFWDCSGITSIDLPTSLETIGESVFVGCSNLSSINIPQGVTSIGTDLFTGCMNLTSITVDPQNAFFKSINGALYDKAAQVLLACPPGSTSLSVPEGVVSIGYGACYFCPNLTNVALPSSLRSIGDGAFDNCLGLTNLTIPDGVTSIGVGAFYSCSFSSINIPDSVTFIGDSAFAYCYKLGSVMIPDSVQSIGYNGFAGCPDLANITFESAATIINEQADYDEYCCTIPSQAIIIGYEPSTAKDYAVTYGRTFQLLGVVVTIDPESPVVSVNTTPLVVTVPEGVTGAVLATTPEAGIVTMPKVTVESSTSVGAVELSISEGTQITGPQDWDGTITLPQVVDTSSVTVPTEGGTAVVTAAIEIGLADTALTFSHPARIVLVGQGGKNAGWIRSGSFTPITFEMASDSAEALGSNADGCITIGSDLVIWTTHFTTFVAYEEKAKYVFGGVLQPVEADGSSIFKLGRNVRLKFQLKDQNGSFISTAVATLSCSKITSTVLGDEFEAVSTAAATTGNLFRYSDNQYIYNLNTKGLTVGTYLLTITLDDGSVHTVRISLK